MKSFERSGAMLGSNRRENTVDSRLKYSLGWPVPKGMRFRIPFGRSLQHSDRLRHVESTVLLIECVCVLFVKICSATSLSGKWVVGEKKRVRSGRKAIRWDFFGANVFLRGIQLAQMSSILHRQKLLPNYKLLFLLDVSSGAYNLVF